MRRVDVTVTAEQPSDSSAVEQVVGAAFAPRTSVARMVAAIRCSPGYEPDLALVARTAEGTVVGFVMVSHAALVEADGREHDVLTLSPLAVAPQVQGRGVGSTLVRAVLGAAAARTDLPRVVVLEGSPVYYERFGFVPAADHGIELALPDGVPAAAAQVYLLPGDDTEHRRGRVRYAPAFDLLD